MKPQHERSASAATARGARALDRARARLHRAVGEVVAGSIEALADRLPSELLAAHAERARIAPQASERLRTVLAIDRSTQAQAARALVPVPVAQASVAPAASSPAAVTPPVAPAPRAPAAAPAGAGDTCDEPIRTRSMARLLAKQGHPQRALAILEYLLARSADDAELRAEAEALRATIAAGGPGSPDQSE